MVDFKNDFIMIGKVLTTSNNRYKSHNILSVREYGITVPSLFTTNGSGICAAKWIMSMLDDAADIRRDVPDFTVQVYINSVRYHDEQSLFEAMMREHRKLWK